MALTSRHAVVLIGLLYFVTFALFLVAFAGPDWVNNSSLTRGLWEECARAGACHSLLTGGRIVYAYWRATEALMCLALIGSLIGLGGHVAWFISVYKSVGDCSSAITWSVNAAVVGSFGTAVFSVLSAIVYGVHTPDIPNGYAYWLNLLCAALYVLTGGLTVVFTRRPRPRQLVI